MLLTIWILTTAIAAASTLAGESRLQARVLPWVGGLLLGIAAFWILPEMAQERGWFVSVAGVGAILLALGLMDRYLFPICPFCAAGVHTHGGDHHSTTLGWPLLIVGCLHSFFDGWAIGLFRNSPISWAAILHKIPESAAIGLLAARMTHSRRVALGTVALVQVAMAGGCVLAISAGTAAQWSDASALPACAFLLLFGFLALRQEWQAHGGSAAVLASVPGLLGCGCVAAMRLLAR